MKCVIDNDGLFEFYLNNLFIKDMQPQIKYLVFGKIEMRIYIEVGTWQAIVWQVDEKEPYAAGKNSLDSWE